MSKLRYGSLFYGLMLLTTAASHAQNFGKSVLINDGRLLIAEPENVYRSGQVLEFTNRNGTWTRSAVLAAPDAQMGDGFGESLAASGDRLIIGSRGIKGGSGAAYIFERQGTEWAHHATLPAEIDAVRFGNEVALSGDFAFVGAPADEEAAGSVFVYRRESNRGWTRLARLAAGDMQENDGFGSALAAIADTLFVGAPGRRSGTGAVYVFTHDGSEWRESGVLESRVLGEGSRLGSTIELSGEKLVAGAPAFGRGVGSALLFAKHPLSGQWMGYALLFPFTAGAPHGFGASVAVDGDELWVGAPFAEGTGTIYRYIPENDRLESVTSLTMEGLDRGDRFGAAIDIAGNTAVVALSGDDYGAGSVAVYQKESSGEWRRSALLQGETGGLAAVTGSRVGCQDGSAGLFDCDGVDLLSFLPISEIGGGRGVQLNDVWGWTDPATGKEYALVGRVDGTSFVDVTDPSSPRYIGDLPKTEGSPSSAWRDMKVYKDHAFIVADNAGTHGMQVFDLTQLRSAAQSAPVTFTPTAHYTEINSAHNIVINTETGFAYTVGNSGGGETCGGGLHMINIQEPKNPTFAGCYAAAGTGRSGTGYTHDAQCIVYRGPDRPYRDREICFSSNETALNVADVTDKSNPKDISTASYPNVSYTHQGWITEDHRYFYVDDELDELSGNVAQTRTLIWDVTDLDDPQLVKEYMWGPTSSDHNLYIQGNFMYQSNYASGLRIHDISDPANPVEVGYFDTTPVGDNGPGFSGSWSNYPYFESGTLVVSSIGEGLFLLKKRDEPGL